jgi:hypothetical protein|tara:strand:+ start:711 stop:980 length:270 start_codon:yes stop_codon:yes gene_type:complete
MNTLKIVLISFIIGSIYYYIMESSIPLDSNCSFISSIWTDILAFVAGIIIIYRSYVHKDDILAMIGGVIIIEHIWQLLPKYTMKKVIMV